MKTLPENFEYEFKVEENTNMQVSTFGRGGAGAAAGVGIHLAWGSELLAILILWNPKRKGKFLICSNYYQDIGY